MTFNTDSRIDSSRVQRRGRSRGGIAVGGGIGGVVLVLAYVFIFGGDPEDLDRGADSGSSVSDDEAYADFEERCATGADANAYADCRVVGAVNSLDAYWLEAMPAAGYDLALPGMVVFDEATKSGCGQASSATGPFYCPGDQTMYVDITFWEVLDEQFGASGGPLAEMYVIAHEYGHHLQNEMGVFAVADRSETGPNSDSVMVELMADCLAGVWAGHASSVPDESGTPFLEHLTQEDIDDALSAAAAVGDDRIQEAVQGEVNPHTFTHGTSEQRQEAFMVGYDGGSLEACEPYNIA